MGAGSTGRVEDRDAIISDLQRQLDGEKDKNRTLEDTYQFRVASFVKRETTTKSKLETLERRLNDGENTDEHNTRMDVVRNMHKTVVTGLDCIQNNTAKSLQDQEKDLMRAFRNRLQEVANEFEAQKSRKGEHSSELQAKHRRVVSELYESQELANSFDRHCQTLQAENQRLRQKLDTRDDDRQSLLKELAIARKELARLKAQIKEGEGSGADSAASPDLRKEAAAKRNNISQKQIEQARLQQTHNKQFEREVSYREAIAKLKRAVETERQASRSLKQHHVEMLQQRSELEVLLRQCLDDVKGEILRQRQQAAGAKQSDLNSPPGVGDQISTVSVHDLSVQDRERVLECLLSQQRVVQLLYSNTFPVEVGGVPSSSNEDGGRAAAGSPSGRGGASCSTSAAPPGAGGGGGGAKDDFSWLSEIIPNQEVP